MTDPTRTKVKEFILDFAKNILGKTQIPSINELKRAYPFHTLFFGNRGLVGFKIQRRVTKRMGERLYPVIAKLVAEDRYAKVFLGDRRKNNPARIGGELDSNRCNVIERIVTELREGRRKPNQGAELDEIFAATGGGRESREVIADLYVEDHPGGPLFLEIKSPLPNINVCEGAKRSMLYFLALMHERGVHPRQAYLAFPYNPFLTRQAYAHTYTRRVMDMDTEVIMAEEFWDLIGGAGTYRELLDIVEQISPEIEEHLPTY